MKKIALLFIFATTFQALATELKKQEETIRRPASITSGQFYCAKLGYNDFGKGVDGKLAEYLTTNCNVSLPFSTMSLNSSMSIGILACCTAR